MKKIALFPGSFDPITLGHESILRRALPLFDEVAVAIGANSMKNNYFSLEQRENWIRTVFKEEPRIKVYQYTGLTIDFCKKIGAKYLLRGLRTYADFEFERGIAQMNKAMYPEIETIFILSTPEYSAINSTIVREIVRHGGDVTPFVPKGISVK